MSQSNLGSQAASNLQELSHPWSLGAPARPDRPGPWQRLRTRLASRRNDQEPSWSPEGGWGSGLGLSWDGSQPWPRGRQAGQGLLCALVERM